MRLKIFDGKMRLSANLEVGALWGGFRNKLETGVGFSYTYYYPRNFQFFNPDCSCASDMKMIPLRLGYRRISKKNTCITM